MNAPLFIGRPVRFRTRAGDAFGASTRPVMSVPEVETAHHAASIMAKDMATWPTVRMSPDAALLPEKETIDARVDELVRNNGIASGAERTFIDNVVGPRITCKPNPDRIALGKSPEWLAEWQRVVEGLWASFADTDWFDAGLRHNFHSATRVQMRGIAASGEGLALPLWDQRNGSKWQTNIQLVDPARLSNPLGAMDTVNLRGGIELDPRGAAVAYHIRKTHPGDFGVSARWGDQPNQRLPVTVLFGQGSRDDWERIPAYQTWGRRRVLHLFDPERVGQTRGKSVITAVARQFKMLDGYMREKLRLAVLDTMVFGALETPMDQAAIAEMFGGAEDPFGEYQRSLNEWRVQMKPGAMIPLPPGTEMKPFSPQRANGEIDTFTTVMLRSIAAGLNMSYEHLTKDFSKTNYSSARAALIEAWRYFMAVRQFMVDRWCSLIYDLWFEEAVNRGMIPDCTPEDYYANQVAWTRCKWIFAGRGWVDPFKEARAADQRLKSKITTRADECGEQGFDWREQIEQQAREAAFERETYEAHGLPWPPIDPNKATAVPASNENQVDATDPDLADDPKEMEAA